MSAKHSPNASKSILEAKAKRRAYRNAAKSIEQSRLAVQTLIDLTPTDDHYALGLLGPILAELRTAAETIDAAGSHSKATTAAAALRIDSVPSPNAKRRDARVSRDRTTPPRSGIGPP